MSSPANMASGPTVQASVTADGIAMSAGAFSFGTGSAALRVDDQQIMITAKPATDGTTLSWSGDGLELVQQVIMDGSRRLSVRSTLTNHGPSPRSLNRVVLFASPTLHLGPDPDKVRILEQNANLGRVRTPRQMISGSDGLAALDNTVGAFVSQTHTVLYHPTLGKGVLLGIETIGPWMPTFSGRMGDRDQPGAQMVTGMDNVAAGTDRGVGDHAGAEPTGHPVPPFDSFTIAFDAGDYRLDPGEVLELGDLVVEVGPDPLVLLDDYGARVKSINQLADAPAPFVNWDSWYPYRLTVTADHVVANARVADHRHLRELGLRYMQVDLGWEVDNEPTYFETNERFPGGFGPLSAQLRELDFSLGAWVGVLCVAASHPIVAEHPEWLLRGADGEPLATGTWFWVPHSRLYGLDVTHPGAQQWLRDGFTALARDGVRYVKFDFAGIVADRRLRGRHDPKQVSAGSRQGVRTALKIAHDALTATGEPTAMIDCSGTDYAGAGITEISYVVMDTGNTGLGWGWLREVYTSFACHRFKRQWALLQPSCLVVGLPGTLEEARLRATITFLGAGHVDLGDDLTTLPADRWPVVLASLPPNDTAARPIDLFEPVATGDLLFLDPAHVDQREPVLRDDPRGASVWVLPQTADWDDWVLVGFANWSDEGSERYNAGRRWRIPLSRLGLAADTTYWAYEFWSGQFCGEAPRPERAPDAYRHGGDFGNPVLESPAGTLEVGFFGPAVKLFALRRVRSHPWPVGTSFHLSGGRELSDVVWDAATRTLSGLLHRPPGETGTITIAGVAGDTGTVMLPVTSTGDPSPWSVICDAG